MAVRAIVVILIIAFTLSGCDTVLTDALPFAVSKPGGSATEWDPDAVLPAGVNLTTFTAGDRDTTFPYYRGGKTYPIKWKVVTGSSGSGSVDPGVYSVKVEYSADGGSIWTVLDPAVATTSDVVTQYDWAIPALQPSGSQYLVRVTATNVSAQSFVATSSTAFTIATTLPTITKYELTLGALGVKDAITVNRSFFGFTLNATSPDLPIKFYCYKVDSSVPPLEDDTCWVNLQERSSQNIAITAEPAFIGFIQNSYSLRIWVMDAAGNISVLNNGTGIVGTDLINLSYTPASAPVIANVIVANLDTASLSPSPTETTFTTSTPVYIKWKMTDSSPGSNPMNLYYTTDEIDFLPITGGQNLTNASQGGCSLTADFTGCYVWANAPSAGYFRIQVRATNTVGLTSSGGSSGLNLSSFSVMAGNTDLGLNGSAEKAVFFHSGGGTTNSNDQGILAVSTSGRIYFLDRNRGILLIDPTDGTVKLYIKSTTSASTGDGGPATSAKTKTPRSINLDYKDRLLILEADRIRRVEADGTISTIIGGGSNYAETGVAAKSFKFQGTPQIDWSMMTPLPNGNIWFTMQGIWQTVPNMRTAIYKAADDKVYVRNYTGNGIKGDPSVDLTVIRSGTTGFFQYSTPGILFDYRTSNPTTVTFRWCEQVPGGCKFWSSTFDARTGKNVGFGIQYPYPTVWANLGYFNSRRGDLYAIDNYTQASLFKFDTTTYTWSKILGNADIGQCADGTLATACSVDMIAAYVTMQNTVYFVDRGKIRVILPDGTVKTIFGQGKDFGDGLSPLSARFNEVNWIGVWGASNKVTVMDDLELKLREVTPGAAGTVTKLAGNGSATYFSLSADLSPTATTVPFYPGYWGGITGLVTDDRDGTVYATTGAKGWSILRLNRSGGNAGKWERIAMGGGTYAYNSRAPDGQLGKSVSLDGYPVTIFGIGYGATAPEAVETAAGEAWLYTSSTMWNGTCHPNYFNKLVRVTDGLFRHVAGLNDYTLCQSSALWPTGTNVENAVGSLSWPANIIESVYMPETRSWLVGQWNASRIVTLPFDRSGAGGSIVSGGVATIFASFGRAIKSFTYKKNASNQYEVYYCGQDGALYRYNTTTLTNVKLTLPTTAAGDILYKCYGRSLKWDNAKNALIFPFKQNNLIGIGKFCTTGTVCP
jgi:large repetitive protein